MFKNSYIKAFTVRAIPLFLTIVMVIAIVGACTSTKGEDAGQTAAAGTAKTAATAVTTGVKTITASASKVSVTTTN